MAKVIDLKILLLGAQSMSHFLLKAKTSSSALSCIQKCLFTVNSPQAAAQGKPTQPMTHV
jgi:hypothetical protein